MPGRAAPLRPPVWAQDLLLASFASCRAAVTAVHGREVAASVQVLPVDRVPLTEQGKPDRAAVRAAAAVAGVPA
jgi:hypothetical protein